MESDRRGSGGLGFLFICGGGGLAVIADAAGGAHSGGHPHPWKNNRLEENPTDDEENEEKTVVHGVNLKRVCPSAT